MSVNRKKKFAEGTCVEFYTVHLSYGVFGFPDASDALAFHQLAKKSVQLKACYESGVDYEDAAGDRLKAELRSGKVKVDDSFATLYFSVTCDQVQVDNINLCGASPCYSSTHVDELDELRSRGWRHMKIDGKDICTCPKCLQRIAEIDGVEPAELQDFDLWEAWRDSQEAMKRKKDA